MAGGWVGWLNKEMPRAPKAPRLPIYEEEYARLMSYLAADTVAGAPASQHHIANVLRVLFTVLYCTGLRISEALTMSKQDVLAFADGGRVTVDCSKTHSTRQLLSVPSLSDKVRAVLQVPGLDLDAVMQGSPRCGFKNVNGTRLTFRCVEKYIYPYMHRLETDMKGSVRDPQKLRFNSHSFRVGYVTRMTRHLPLQDVSYIVGHSSVQTTLAYTRSDRDMTRFNEQLKNTVV